MVEKHTLLSPPSLGATLSNCGKVLKAFATKQMWKHVCGLVNDLGYGKNAKHEPIGEMDNPQPSPKGPDMAYGCSSQTKWQWVHSLGLRYSRACPERGLVG